MGDGDSSARWPSFLGLREDDGPDRADVCILPVPFDGTACYRKGAAEAPRAILEASVQLETWEPELGLDFDALRYRTLRALECMGRSAREVVRMVEAEVGRIADEGVFPLVIGGEHSITVGAVRALAARRKGMAVLQVDAHADLREIYEGDRYSHACVMRRIYEEGIPFVPVGVRSYSPEERDFARREGIEFFSPWKLGPGWVDEVVERLPDEVYLTFDVDGLDPSVMPGTGTPEPEGLGYGQAVELVRAVTARRRLLGFDIVEVAPQCCSNVSEFIAAKLAAVTLALALGPGADRACLP